MKLLVSLAALLLASALGGYAQQAVQSGMTSDSHCGTGYCVTAVYSPLSKQLNYTMIVAQGGKPIGWWSVAQGTRMSGSNMAVGWVNGDGTITLSHQSSQGHSDPTEALAASTTFTANTDVMRSNAGTTVFSWIMDVPSGASMTGLPHIFAMSPNTPTSSSTGASLRKHSRTEEGISLDMTKAYTGAAPAGLQGAATNSTTTTAGNGDATSNASEASSSSSSSSSSNLFLAHMICMTLAWMLCFPVGMLVARYGRLLFRWYPTHAGVQMVGLAVVAVGFGLGVAGVSQSGDGHFSNTHEVLGLILCVGAVVQAGLGYGAHLLRNKTGKRYLGFAHMPLGVLMIAVAVWTIKEGFEVWDQPAPKWAPYVIYAWIAVVAVAYAAGALRLRKERDFNRRWQQEHFGGQAGNFVSGGGVGKESSVDLLYANQQHGYDAQQHYADHDEEGYAMQTQPQHAAYKH